MHCRIGGEISNSIMFRYLTKLMKDLLVIHIGEWVNMVFMSTTSNLKLNYNTVKVNSNNQNIDTGEQFLGSIIGDHGIRIGTLLNTGTIVGYGSSIYGRKIHDKNIPPFKWGKAGKYHYHDQEKFLATAELVQKDVD